MRSRPELHKSTSPPVITSNTKANTKGGRNRDSDCSALASAGSLIGILLLLHIDFQSWRVTLLVFLTIPFALVGGRDRGVMLQGGVLSLGSLVGFVATVLRHRGPQWHHVGEPLPAPGRSRGTTLRPGFDSA